jgi:hypothetical protein
LSAPRRKEMVMHARKYFCFSLLLCLVIEPALAACGPGDKSKKCVSYLIALSVVNSSGGLDPWGVVEVDRSGKPLSQNDRSKMDEMQAYVRNNPGSSLRAELAPTQATTVEAAAARSVLAATKSRLRQKQTINGKTSLGTGGRQ